MRIEIWRRRYRHLYTQQHSQISARVYKKLAEAR